MLRLPRIVPRPARLVICLPLLLGACTPFARFNAQPLDPAASAATLTNRSLTGKTWTLAALIDEAIAHHPDIRLAKAKYDTAAAAIPTAAERPNPTVAISPQVVTPITKWTTGTYGVDFDWTFETAGKRSRRIDLAQANVRTAAAEVIDTTWKVRAAVRKAALELYAAEQRATFLTEAISRQDELLAALDERIKAGAEARSATSQARLLAAQLKLQAAESARLAATARASLAEALAMSTSGLARARFSWSAFGKTDATLPGKQNALTHRADVLAALSAYAAAESALQLEIAKQYPDFHLNPGYQLDTGENKWTLGVGLTLPLLNHNQGGVGEAEARRREAAAMVESVQAKVLADYDRAATALAAARKKLATTDALLAEQDAQIASEDRLLKAGSGDRTALLSARVERATIQAGRIDALTDIQTALGDLEAAAQTPLP